jgi:hypothetical protein
MSTCSHKQEDDTRFIQVGRFESEKLEGFTYYVENPTKKAISSLCSKKKERDVDDDEEKRLVKIGFFDDRDNTPNVTVTWTYDWPESASQHLVAECFHDPFTDESGLEFHKEIPE